MWIRQTHADWEWEDGNVGSGNWRAYGQIQISCMNIACTKQSTLRLPIWHTTLPGSSRSYYTVDFHNLTQKRDTTSCVRAVRCNSGPVQAKMLEAQAEWAASKRKQEEAEAAAQEEREAASKRRQAEAAAAAVVLTADKAPTEDQNEAEETAKRRKKQGAGQGGKRHKINYDGAHQKDQYPKVGDKRRVRFRMGDKVGDEELMFLAIVSSVQTATKTSPDTDRQETHVVKVTVKYVDTSKPATKRRLPQVSPSDAFYGYHLMEQLAQKRILTGNAATETSFKSEYDYKANSTGGNIEFDKLFAKLYSNTGQTAPTDESNENAVKRKRSDTKFQSQPNGAKSREDPRSADDSPLAGGKRKAAKKTARAGSTQQPAQKSQPSKSTTSKPEQIKPRGTQASSPGSAANQNGRGDKTTANCAECGHLFHAGPCRPRGASAHLASAAAAPMNTDTGQGDHIRRGHNPDPDNANYLVGVAMQREAGMPPDYRNGEATSKNHNCLIHSLMQLVTKESHQEDSPGWKEQEIAANTIRRTVVELDLDKSVKVRSGYLELETYWEPILRALGVEPRKYQVICYNKHGNETHGNATDNVLRLNSVAYAHYVPVFKKTDQKDDGAKPANAAKTAVADGGIHLPAPRPAHAPAAPQTKAERKGANISRDGALQLPSGAADNDDAEGRATLQAIHDSDIDSIVQICECTTEIATTALDASTDVDTAVILITGGHFQ